MFCVHCVAKADALLADLCALGGCSDVLDVRFYCVALCVVLCFVLYGVFYFALFARSGGVRLPCVPEERVLCFTHKSGTDSSPVMTG